MNGADNSEGLIKDTNHIKDQLNDKKQLKLNASQTETESNLTTFFVDENQI